MRRGEISTELAEEWRETKRRAGRLTRADSIRGIGVHGYVDDRYMARENARSSGPSHTGRRAASRRMLRGIWPRVRAGHCDSCIVRISSVHFRTSALSDQEHD